MHGLLNGLVDWYLYVYMYGWNRQLRCVTVWLYVFGYKLLFHDTITFCLTVSFCVFGGKWLCHETRTFYSLCFIFHLEVTCCLHVLQLWYRWKRGQSRKLLLYYLVFKDKKLSCENSSYRVFIIARQSPKGQYFLHSPRPSLRLRIYSRLKY